MYSSFYLLLILAHLTVHLHTATAQANSPEEIASLIPSAFIDQNIMNYKIRYVSEDGNDTDSCLGNQLPSGADSSDPISYCRTLRYALFGNHEYRGENISNLMVLMQPGNYPYGNVSIYLEDFTNLVISKAPGTVGEVVLYCQEYLVHHYNNLYFTYSSYVAINEVVFERCGPLSPGMGVFEVTMFYVTNCIARNNRHSGIVAFQAVDMTIQNCTFEDNYSEAFYNISESLNPGEIRFAGGLSISWKNLVDSSGEAHVIDCTFINNTASRSPLNSNDTRPNLYIPQGHGGAIVAHFYNTTNYKLVINGATFTRNRAKFNGGGAFFTFYNTSRGNRVEVVGSVFEENRSENGTGGGISMSTFYKANDNQLEVRDSKFMGNVASIGGGGSSINIQDQLIKDDEQIISNLGMFNNCVFQNNSSPEGGSAISIVSNARVDQALEPTKFTDCSFLQNSANEEGAVRSLRFPIAFYGNTIFKDNLGGGVAVLQSRMDISGTVWFEGNSALDGGAVALRDQSVIHVLRDVNITFYKNKATNQGGAISVISPSVGLDTDIVRLFNTRCFIQYDVINTDDSTPPSQWNASFAFIDNEAFQNGAAIYATDIKRCTYTPSLNTSENATVAEMSMFELPDLFYFSGNKLTVEENKTNEYLASAPTDLVISPRTVSGAPGEVIEFSVRALDQSGNWRRAVWSLLDNSAQQDATMGQDYFVLTPDGSTHRYTIHSKEGMPFSNCTVDAPLHEAKVDFNLVQIIAGDIASSTTSTVSVRCCHPGYHFSRLRSTCEYDRPSAFILRADINHRYLYIEPEHYAEVRNGTLVSAVMPPTFQDCTKQGTLRGCLFKYDNPYQQCSSNRTGFLCGRCPENQRLDLTLRSCKDCSAADYVIFALIVLAFVVATILVLIFNIGVPNDLKGCFFFVQVVGFVYQGSADWDFHLSRFFASFYIPTCPLTDHRAYVTASYGLIPSVIAFLAIIIYVICARFIRRLGTHSSLEGIWLLFIIMIKYAADTAFALIRCQKVVGVHGEYVYFYEGTTRCFAYDESTSHLGFAIIAIFILVLVAAATVGILVVSYRRFQHTQAFTDILTKDIKVSCRWWSFFDLSRRLIFVVVAFLLNYLRPEYNQLAQFAVGVIIFFVFACSQPYNEKRANIIESLILLDLLILTSLFLNTADQSLNDVSNLAAVLLIIPFLFGFLYILVKVISILWKRFSPTSFMKFYMQIQDLVTTGHWKGRVKGGITHNLDTIISVTKSKNGSLVETELNLETDQSEFSASYSELREELLENAPL